MNLSFLTTLISIIFTIGGYFSPVLGQELFMIGVFALSGSVTNWLAIHMLFEKVPFLYGSGVIPERFEEFKTGIKNLMMKEFFNEENIKKFISLEENQVHQNVEQFDFDQLFFKLLEVVETSQFGSMLAMFGGTNVLMPMKDSFVEKVKAEVVHQLDQKLPSGTSNNNSAGHLLNNVENIVQSRLNELTPNAVKNIIKDMIEKHLGWLVVWGGVFGGVIGLISSKLPILTNIH